MQKEKCIWENGHISTSKIFRWYRSSGRIIQTCGLPQLAGASPVSSFWSCGFLLMLLQPLLQWHCSHFGFFLPQDKFTILYFSYGRFFSWWIIYSSSNWNDTIQRIFDKQMLFWNPNSSAFIISWIIPNWWSNDGWSGGNLGHKFSPSMGKRLRVYNFSSRSTF